MQILFFPISLDTIIKDPDIDNMYQYKDYVSYEEYKDLLFNNGESSHDKNYDITYYDRRETENEIEDSDEEAYWDK